MQQGLSDEAEEIYRRALALVPGHPQAMVRIGEIEAARGEAPSAPAVEAADPVASSSDGIAEVDADADVDVEVDVDVDVEVDDAVAEESVGLSAEEDAAAADTATLVQGSSAPPATTAAPQRAEARTAPPAASAAPAAAAEAGFDLAAELSEALDDEAEAKSSPGGASDEAFAAVFREFKKGVSKTLSEGDYEAHYDLGIAYREMGLLDDAMGEFRAALGSPTRRLGSLHMLGMCALDRGASSEAVEHFGEAMASPELASDQEVALRFSLGNAFEAMGDTDGARSAYQAVAAVDSSFCDVAERLASLGDSEAPEDSGAEVAEPEAQDAGAEQVAAEFESFDDLIAEANADEPPPPKKRKKKKISFV